jgi:HTH-type transcriptional regulator, transcriptional repressor of NAD biosynthesis genes
MPGADVLRVCLLGAESTGKTTMSRALAERFDTVWVPEYGRGYTEVARPPKAPWRSDELVHIVQVQGWLESQLADQADRFLFCDTDAFTTSVFHEVLVGGPLPDALREAVERERYDLFFLCGTDVPFVQDGWRDDRVRTRLEMHVRYRAFLEERGERWLLLEGDHEARLAVAEAAVLEL